MPCTRKKRDQVANTRHGRAGGNHQAAARPAGQDGRPRADRCRTGRPQARRSTSAFRAAIAAVSAVLAVVVTLVAVKLTSNPVRPVASESQASSVVVRQVTTVPAAVLTRVSPGQEITPLQMVKTSGPPLTIGGKPAIVFVSEESCPFCAAERWSLTVALAHFGTWSHLGSTTSSATDVYPSTATLSFRTAVYHSTELTLRTTELADNAGRPLQAQTPLDTRLIDAFDVPPYVNSADQSGAVPFLDIANRYILAGAQYNPQVLAGLSAPRLPASSATRRAQWPRPSTGQRRSSSQPSTRSCTTSRPRCKHPAYPAAENPAGRTYRRRSSRRGIRRRPAELPLRKCLAAPVLPCVRGPHGSRRNTPARHPGASWPGWMPKRRPPAQPLQPCLSAGAQEQRRCPIGWRISGRKARNGSRSGGAQGRRHRCQQGNRPGDSSRAGGGWCAGHRGRQEILGTSTSWRKPARYRSCSQILPTPLGQLA